MKYSKTETQEQLTNFRRMCPPGAKVSTPCTVHHVNFGGGCLNCGYGLTKTPKPTKAERIAHLRALGFTFPKES